MLNRKQILAKLHLSRANILQSIVGLPREAYTIPLWDDWTIQSLLPHIALWDSFEAGRLHTVVHGNFRDAPPSNVDERNAEWHTRFKDTPIETGIAMLLKERNGLLNVFKTVPDDKLDVILEHGEFRLPLIKPLSNGWEHDIVHTQEIIAFREAHQLDGRAQGVKAVLTALLRTTPKTVGALCGLAADPTTPINGGWSAHQLVSHFAGWESHNLDGLKTRQSPPQHPSELDLDNQKITEARVNKSFDEVFQEYVDVRRQVIDYIDPLDDVGLAAPIDNHYGWQDTPFKWATIYPRHDLEHCAELSSCFLRDEMST